MIKEAIKAVESATTFEDAFEKFKKATSVLDKKSAKRILHKNTAANKKSQLARHVFSLKEKSA